MTDKSTIKQWSETRRKYLSTEQIEKNRRWAEQKTLEMNLREVRKLVGKTQKDVEEASVMAQSEVSQVEQREDHLVSTLRKFIEALGGQLDIIARFGDKTIKLKGV
jgi:CRISPR/Cas system-associated exonuclease Cas4 (RecB family)